MIIKVILFDSGRVFFYQDVYEIIPGIHKDYKLGIVSDTTIPVKSKKSRIKGLKTRIKLIL